MIERILKNKSGVVCGWVSPRGEFFPCGPCEHRRVAEEIVDKYNINCMGNSSADYVLEREGYIRITEDNVYSLQTSMYIDESSAFKKVTQDQLNILLDNYYEFNEEQKKAIKQLVKLVDL